MDYGPLIRKKDRVGIRPKDDPSWLQVALLPFSSATRLEDFCVAQRSQVVSVLRNFWGNLIAFRSSPNTRRKKRRAVKMAGSVGKVSKCVLATFILDFGGHD